MPLSVRVLLLEDNDARARQVAALLEGAGAAGEVSCRRAGDVSEAASVLQRTHVDLLVLDVCVPMRRGEEPAPDGGVRLLRALKSRKELMVPGNIVGLTGYGDLAAKYSAEFNASMWMLVRYEDSSDEWARRLVAHVQHMLEAQRAATSGYDYDIGIVTALYGVELEAVLALDGGWSTLRQGGDDALYHVGVFKGDGAPLRVVATAAIEMGMPATAALSMKVIERFRPRYLAMTGIAAGVKGSFGDILVADQSWDYGSGKVTGKRRANTQFCPAPTAIQLGPALQYRLNWFAARRSTLARIQAAWSGKRPSSSLRVHIGPMASGASVVAARRVIAGVQRHNRKVIGIEMETYGLFVAARMCSEPRPQALSVKSVCDFGGAKKDDRYQAYAAYTSAQFVYEFAREALAVRSHVPWTDAVASTLQL